MTIISVEGDEATWKTGFAYTAPMPSMGLQFDEGFDRAVYGVRYKELFQGVDFEEVEWDDPGLTIEKLQELWWRGPNAVTVVHFPEPLQLDMVAKDGYSKMFSRFEQLFYWGLSDPVLKTLIVDTMSMGRDFAADSYLETLQKKRVGSEQMRQQLIEIEYKDPNAHIRTMYSSTKVKRKNFIATHHLTDERKDGPLGRDGKPTRVLTGRQVLRGWNQTYKAVDVALRNKVIQTKDPTVPEGVSTLVECTYMKCGPDLSKVGKKLYNPTWNLVAEDVNRSIHLEKAKIELREVK